MSDRIEPALSAGEWLLFGASKGQHIIDGQPMYVHEKGMEFENMDPAGFQVPLSHLPALIALANAALPYSDDRKIKNDWVSWLREEAEILQRNGAGAGALMAREIADALASYLPPHPESVIESPLSPDVFAAPPGVRARQEYAGGTEGPCPECGSPIATKEAGHSEQMANGIRFVDVPCHACGAFFTIEMFKEAPPDAPGAMP